MRTTQKTCALLVDARDVLTVALDCCPEPRRLPNLYEMMSFMTRVPVRSRYFHDAWRECRAWLLQEHPALRALDPPRESPEQMREWIERMAQQMGSMVWVQPH